MKNKNFNILNMTILFTILILIFSKSLYAYDPREDVKYDSSTNNLFWFIQASDTHIGDENIESARGKLNDFLITDYNGINPKLVVVTGDLTDATNPNVSWGILEPFNKLFNNLKTQQKDEWIDYGLITGSEDPSIYFDLPGNHDRHGDPEWKGLYDSVNDIKYGYTINSVLGKSRRSDTNIPAGQFLKTITVNGNSYLFIGVNTCDSTGAEFDPNVFNFQSDYPDLSSIERDYIKNELIKFQNKSNPKLSFIFGHAGIYRLVRVPNYSLISYGLSYPGLISKLLLNKEIEIAKEYGLNEIGGPDENRGGKEFVGLLNQYNVSAYLFGHTHKDRDLYDLNSKHNINSRLINTSSLTDQNTYRIVAVDNNGVSTITAKLDEWPVILITSPLEVKATGLNNIYWEQTIDNPYKYTIKSDSTNFVRAIAFFDPSQTDKKVEFRYKKKSWVWSYERLWVEMKEDASNSNVWQGNWNCAALESGEYDVQVRAKGLGAKEAIHEITIKIDNNECTFLYPNSGEVLGGKFPLKAIINRSLSEDHLYGGRS